MTETYHMKFCLLNETKIRELLERIPWNAINVKYSMATRPDIEGNPLYIDISFNLSGEIEYD